MVQNAFLQIYDLTLTTSGPLHIGSGDKMKKKSYVFNPRKQEVSVFREDAFFSLLLKYDLVDAFESFAMGPDGDLYTFLTDNNISDSDWNPAVLYTVKARDSLNKAHPLKDINPFLRNAYGKAYLPGSSVKGALKTVLLNQKILQDEHRNADTDRNFGAFLDETYLHTLNLYPKDPRNAVNNLMRGIQISDSLPISDANMILTLKKDAHVDGHFSAGSVVCRESIRPGVQIHLKLTLDQSILQNTITGETIMESIREYNAYYAHTYVKKFQKPPKAVPISPKPSLILGGGAGFFSKTLVYPYFGKEKGLQMTANSLYETFDKKRDKNKKRNKDKEKKEDDQDRKFGHEKDVDLGISPHTMEYAQYNGQYYPMGICEVSIQ